MRVFRIGYGYDVHALVKGLPLIIGGVNIEHEKGFTAHSDGDILAHAVCDALLGAAALGDIGVHFPDTSEKFKGVDSMILLSRVGDIIRENGYMISNIDSTVVMQTPKLSPHIAKMRENIATILNIDIDAVSVKATTEERLGFTGNEQGASAHAAVLIFRE